MKTAKLLLIALALAGCATAKPVAVADLPALPHLAQPAPGVFASGRLTAVDMESIKDAGIREVIDLTLDSETPEFDEAAAARSRGLHYRNLPIEGASALTTENVRAFDALLRAAKRPVLVHCSSGNRVGALAALRAAWLYGYEPAEAVALGKAWGLKGLEAEVRNQLQAGPPEGSHDSQD